MQTCLYPPPPKPHPLPPPPFPQLPSFVSLFWRGRGWGGIRRRGRAISVCSCWNYVICLGAGWPSGGGREGRGGGGGGWGVTGGTRGSQPGTSPGGCGYGCAARCRPPGVGARWQGCGCSPTPWAPSIPMSIPVSIPMARPHGKARAGPGLCCSAAPSPIWVCQPLYIPPSIGGSKPGDPVAASRYGEGTLRRMPSSQRDPSLGMPLLPGITLGASLSSSPNTLRHILHLQTHVTPAAERCRH